jgi:hypothetical protein
MFSKDLKELAYNEARYVRKQSNIIISRFNPHNPISSATRNGNIIVQYHKSTTQFPDSTRGPISGCTVRRGNIIFFRLHVVVCDKMTFRLRHAARKHHFLPIARGDLQRILSLKRHPKASPVSPHRRGQDVVLHVKKTTTGCLRFP